MKLGALIVGLVLALGAASAQQHGTEPAKPAPAPAQQPPAHEPAAKEPGAHETGAGEHAEGAEHAEGEHALSSSETFMALFKHLEPHPVFGVWFGGSAGPFRIVKPYVTDAAGAPAAF